MCFIFYPLTCSAAIWFVVFVSVFFFFFKFLPNFRCHILQLAEGVAVNARCHIDGGSRGVIIGKNTRLGPGCYIFAFNHGIAPDSDIKDQPVSSEGIIIGDDVWVRSFPIFLKQLKLNHELRLNIINHIPLPIFKFRSAHRCASRTACASETTPWWAWAPW